MPSIPDRLPAEKRELLDRVVAELQKLPQVAALALGGSHALGLARPSSNAPRTALPASRPSSRTPEPTNRISAARSKRFAIYGRKPWALTRGAYQPRFDMTAARP